MGSIIFGGGIAPSGEVPLPQHDNIDRGVADREGNGGRA